MSEGIRQVNLKSNDVIKRLAGLDMWEQLNQTQEECAELITAINHFRRKKTAEEFDHLCEEIADVIIMVNQCTWFLDESKINKKITEKLARAGERLKNGTI
jgi:NTP pyrophosphatase (non-canonical NTP hydrolase)